MDARALSAELAALVGDLTVASPADAAQLEAACSVVAAALSAGRAHTAAASPGGGALASAVDARPTEMPDLRETSGDAPLVLRRDLPVQPLTGPGAMAEWAAGRAAETLGPFVGALGQPVLIDSFAAAVSASLRRTSAASPFLVIAGSEPQWSAQGEGRLGAGSVWIAASLLDATAPASSWIGLAIDGGVIRGAAPTPGPAGVLVVADAAVVELELELAVSAPPAGAGPGQDARDADVRLPGKVALRLAAASAKVAELDDARVTAYGATVHLTNALSAAYVPTLRSVLVRMETHDATWAPQAHASDLAALAGGGPLADAGWALPVTVADPATLGAAAGAGSVALLVEDLTLAFAGQARPVPAGLVWLLARPGLLMIAADAALGAGLGVQAVLYPDLDGAPGVGGRASFRFADAFLLRYLVDGSGTETILTEAAFEVSLDRPVTADGARLPLAGRHGLLGLVQTADGTTLVVEGVPDTPLQRPLPVALDNALLQLGAPTLLFVRAALADEALPQLAVRAGSVAIRLPLRSALPTLPDPYAATLTPTPTRELARGHAATVAAGTPGLLGRVDWDTGAEPAGPQLAFTMSARQAALAGAAAPVRADVRAADEDEALLVRLAARVEEMTGSVPGPIALLDVSSAADQFGVRYGIAEPRRSEVAGPAAASGPSIEGLSVVAPANTIRVITLPAVQWEPVSGPDPSGPFSPLTFPDSGGETQLASRSVRLVPVAPAPALEQLVTDFEAEGKGVVASITFPSGIRAVVLLERSVSPLRPNAALDVHRPAFASPAVLGGQQLRAAAVRGLLLPGGHSPSFPGAAVQLSNGMHDGEPPNSPLDTTLTGLFNGEFGPGGTHEQVPVGRFELSGYGESLFSDWTSSSGDAAGIGQVRFDVLVGRTSVDIIEAYSTMQPYGVRVIRAIKLLRDNAGRVQRTDTGWKAVGDGRYAWPRSDVRTHPGVVLGVTDVVNIRETGQTWTASDGTRLMAVRFDCRVDLDGIVAGAGSGGAPSHGQLGFVQISDTPTDGLSPAGFAELIEAFGPLGGSVDAVIGVGDAGLRSRVSHVGVGVTAGMTGPEFVMAAWGSPELPKGGSWSVVRRAAGDPASGPVDAQRGVPLIRAGYAGAPPDPTSPYRYADPADLAVPGAPAADYALMHATSSQRVLFPRPKVELSGPRAHQLSSTQAPLLADPFLLTTAVAAFPPVADAIAFPDADYGLRALGGGDLALDLADGDFPVTGGDRTIHDAGGTTLLVRYGDEDGAPAMVHLELDSSSAVPWACRVGALELCLATGLLGEVIRLRGVVEASAAQPARFTGGTVHLGGAFKDIEPLIDVLGKTRLADIPLGSRNQPSLEIALKIPIVGAPGEPDEIDIGIGSLVDADVTVGVKIDLATGAPTARFELAGTVTGRTPYPPIVAAGQLKLVIESDASGNVFEFTLGLGFGVSLNLGFDVDAYVFQNDYFVVGTNEIGFGIGLELKAKIDFEVVEAEIDVEALALLMETNCPAGTTWWLVSQLTIGVDITIAWVIDIDFEYQLQMQTNLDGGPCPAPMV